MLIIPFESKSQIHEGGQTQANAGVWFTIFNRKYLKIEKPVVFKLFFYYWVRFKILNPGFFCLAKKA
jgi:hypothetical protein